MEAVNQERGTTPLRPNEERLVELEHVIERGLNTYIEVGTAIQEIRDNKLYKEDYKTFEEYCRDRWGWTKRYVNYQIEAANTAEALGTIVPKPTTESQARELTPLVQSDAEKAKEVWRSLIGGGQVVTAKRVKEAVKEAKDKEKPKELLEQSEENTAQETSEEDPAGIRRIVRAGAMEYVVEFNDGRRHTTTRDLLLREGFKKCSHCSGYGIVERGTN